MDLAGYFAGIGLTMDSKMLIFFEFIVCRGTDYIIIKGARGVDAFSF